MSDQAPLPPAAAAGDGVAVVIPCHNEETSIAKVIADFRAALPRARVVVVDNASSDGTAACARSAGAEVVSERRRGKGYALLRGFQQVRGAACVVMVDGDDTYPAENAAELVDAVQSGRVDMAIGTRLQTFSTGAYPVGHNFGNRLFILLVRVFFGVRTTDLFSGYRALSGRFLELSPLIAQGFEIETELSLQALVGNFAVAEVPVHYRQRPAGSSSKLRTLRDGYRILLALLAFFRDYRPLTFFGIVSLAFALASFVAGGVVVAEYLRTGQVLRIPLAILSVGLLLLAAVSAIAGIVLSSISRRAAELAALISRR
ncbi:MAG TPA: glycosyltransferase family 2 protein [Myxococcales bacterium]